MVTVATLTSFSLPLYFLALYHFFLDSSISDRPKLGLQANDSAAFSSAAVWNDALDTQSQYLIPAFVLIDQRPIPAENSFHTYFARVFCLSSLLKVRFCSRMRKTSSTSFHPRIHAVIPSNRASPSPSTSSTLHFVHLRWPFRREAALCFLAAINRRCLCHSSTQLSSPRIVPWIASRSAVSSRMSVFL